MKIHKLGPFRFDVRSLKLTRHRASVALRPKAASVLKVLLENAPHIVSKRDLALSVWGSEHVRDQSVFQTVSELRQALAPLEPICTHPNLGYQIVVGPPSVQRQRWLAAAVLACAIGLSALFVGQAWTPSAHDAATATVSLTPALRAFTAGLTDLAAGRAGSAEQNFALAVAENPGFDEARLMRIESLLAQGRIDEAQTRARALAVANATSRDAYPAMAAMDLMSRAGEAAGQTDMALHWALEAAKRARTMGFSCAAAELDDRIAALIGPPPSRSPETPTEPPLQASHAPAPEYCDQMSPWPGESGALSRENRPLSALCVSRKIPAQSLA